LLRREYPSAVVTATAVYLVHAARTFEWPHLSSVSIVWTTAYALVLAGAFCLRLISHRTDLLKVASPEGDSESLQADAARGSIGSREL
jgi:hypothetical protein